MTTMEASMLSDSIRQMRKAFQTGFYLTDTAGLLLALKAYELEARNMEDRIELLSGQPHTPLDGRLVERPAPVIEISSHAGSSS